MNLDAAAQVIVERLKAAGIRATLDERDINPPCVYVRPPGLTFRFGKGWDAQWAVVCVVPDNGAAYALAALGSLVADVSMELGTVAARPVSLQVPGGAAPFPGYEMTFTERINP